MKDSETLATPVLRSQARSRRCLQPWLSEHGRIESVTEFADVVFLATKFLICGTIRGQVPYKAIEHTREKNRRLGLGLMGMHEWLIQRGERYEVTPELHKWLYVYKTVSDTVSRTFADQCSVSRPVANRAIAPTGSIVGYWLALALRSTRSLLSPIRDVILK